MHASSTLEERLFHSYWDDGLLDVLAGLALLSVGIAWAVGLGSWAAVLAPVWLVLWRPLRQRFVEPRAGFVRFSLERRRRLDRSLAGAGALGVGLLLLVALTAFLVSRVGPGPGPAHWAAGLPALLVALAAVVAALLTGARRFHLYGLGLLLAAVGVVLVAGDPSWPLVFGGLLVTASGLGLFARFLRDSAEFRGGD